MNVAEDGVDGVISLDCFGYEVYGKLGIYQRNLSNFEETAILENTAAPGACLNCHTANIGIFVSLQQKWRIM